MKDDQEDKGQSDEAKAKSNSLDKYPDSDTTSNNNAHMIIKEQKAKAKSI